MVSSLPIGLGQASVPPRLIQVDPAQLKSHPRNSCIYGSDEDVTELVEMIRASGWVKPLVITPLFVIISGHRRWKAALELGLEGICVEVREFLDETAELEALLLENASRLKTIEQKVREAQAWKDVETIKARRRQIELAGFRPNLQTTSNLQPNLAEGYEKGQTRDKVAQRVGLRRTTYEKAAKVVRAIDIETSQGNLGQATALRKILNEQSVDAAVQLLKKSCEERQQILSLISASTAKNTKEAISLIKQSQDSAQKLSSHRAIPDSVQELNSCWNCQHRGESIENHSFYCYHLGVLSLIDKSADVRAAECTLWSYQQNQTVDINKTQSTQTFTLTLPAHLQPLLQDAARTKGMSVVDWATWVLESEALSTRCPSGCTNSSAVQQTDKTECQQIVPGGEEILSSGCLV